MSGPIDVDSVLADALDRLFGVPVGPLRILGPGRALRRLPKQGFESAVLVRADAPVAAAAFSAAISRLGRFLGSRPDGPDPLVVGVVLSLNPAVIEVRFAPMGAGRCRATVIGVAKEGMIKQATAEKAVRRVLGAPEVGDLQGPQG